MMRDQLRDGTMLRFLIVGASLSAIYAILAALATSQLSWPKAVSSTLLWLVFIPVGFWGHRRFTFATRTPHRHGVWLYAAIQGLGVGIIAAISFLLARGSFWPDLFVHLFAAGLAAVTSYLINRWIVFPDQSAR
jgi:putative flippase GtrA